MKYLTLIFLLLHSSVLFAESKNLPNLDKFGGDFTLHSVKGDVTLSDFRDKVVLLYFGYINCPDACPTTLSHWAKAFRKLTPDERSKVQGIMVSIDPERDTLAELDAFTDFFHENIIGISGSHKQLKQVAAQFDASYTIPDHLPGKNYGVDHSFYEYLIDPMGKMKERFDFTLPVDELVTLLRKYIAN